MTRRDPASGSARTADLLWNGGRSRLSLERVVATAVALADADGLDALSMRAVAQRLGFTPMSLYRHVAGRTQMVELMRDAVFAELPDPPDAARRRDWRAELDAWARALWELHLRHPWLVRTGGPRVLPGPHALAAYDRALAAAERTGLPPTEVVAVVSLLTGFVEAAARQAVEILSQQRDSGVSQMRWWHGQEELRRRVGPYSAVARIWRAGGFDEFEDPLDFGLARTLDGVEMRVRRHRGGPDAVDGDSRDRAVGGSAAGECGAHDGKRYEKTEAERRCAVCGGALAGARRGRPRAYCSSACRQRAYRRRGTSGVTGAPAHTSPTPR